MSYFTYGEHHLRAMPTVVSRANERLQCRSRATVIANLIGRVRRGKSYKQMHLSATSAKPVKDGVVPNSRMSNLEKSSFDGGKVSLDQSG